SQACYLRALDDCYNRLAKKKEETLLGRGGGGGSQEQGAPFTMECVDHLLFHSPYNKLVQKSFGRMVFADAQRLNRAGGELLDVGKREALAEWLDVPAKDTYADRGLEAALKKLDKNVYKAKVEPGC
ncbi:unnamed protein product, partial [Discosporangium mesarthrocarpum]